MRKLKSPTRLCMIKFKILIFLCHIFISVFLACTYLSLSTWKFLFWFFFFDFTILFAMKRNKTRIKRERKKHENCDFNSSKIQVLRDKNLINNLILLIFSIVTNQRQPVRTTDSNFILFFICSSSFSF